MTARCTLSSCGRCGASSRRYATPTEFKYNCNLVLIDFFVRHGLLSADDPDFCDDRRQVCAKCSGSTATSAEMSRCETRRRSSSCAYVASFCHSSRAPSRFAPQRKTDRLTVTARQSTIDGQRGHGHAENHDWYKDLKQPGTGYSCCNGTFNGVEGDCRPTRAYQTEDGAWRALVDGRWQLVPPRAVLQQSRTRRQFTYLRRKERHDLLLHRRLAEELASPSTAC